MHLRSAPLVLTAAVLLLGTACGRGSEGEEADPAPDRPAATRDADRDTPDPVDPPRGFAPRPVEVGEVAALDDPEYTVFGDAVVTGYADEDVRGRTVVDVRSLQGAQRARFTVDDAAPGSAPYGVVTGDGALVLVATAHTTPGTGTQQDRHAYRVAAWDADSAAPRWTATLPSTPQRPLPADGEVEFGGADADTVLLRHRKAASDDSVTFALNTADGSLRWAEAGFTPWGVEGEVVVGLHDASGTELVGLSVRDGRTVWRGPKVRSRVAGQTLGHGLATVSGGDPDRLTGSVTHLVDTATGKARVTLPEQATCHHDDARTVVCRTSTPYRTPNLIGYDAGSGAKLWELTGQDAQRQVPTLVGARPGVVYVRGSNGLSTLAARTGADLDTDLPDLELTEVVEGYGIGFGEKSLDADTRALHTYRGTDATP